MNEVIERIRENLKESAKGVVQRELTVEFMNGDKINLSLNPKDLADVVTKEIETDIWDRYEKLGELGRKRGFKIAGDNNEVSG